MICFNLDTEQLNEEFIQCEFFNIVYFIRLSDGNLVVHKNLVFYHVKPID